MAVEILINEASPKFAGLDMRHVSLTIGAVGQSPMFYNFKRANIMAIRDYLRHNDIFAFCDISIYPDIDMTWAAIYNTIMELINKYVPKIKIRNSNAPEWLDCDVVKASKKKMRAFKKAKTLKTKESWEKFTKIRNYVKKLMSWKYKCYINDLSASLNTNPKRFWGFLKTKSKNKSSPTTILENGQEYTDPAVKANIFNTFFHSVFSRDEHMVPPEVNATFDPNLNNISISVSDVLKNLKALDPSKAIGPDGIPTRILKECANELANPLTKM